MKNLIKSVFILCFITSLSTSAQAQFFKHGAGIQFDFFRLKTLIQILQVHVIRFL